MAIRLGLPFKVPNSKTIAREEFSKPEMGAPTTEKTAMDAAKETEKKQTEVERIQNIIELRKTNLNPRKSAIAAHSKFEKV